MSADWSVLKAKRASRTRTVPATPDPVPSPSAELDAPHPTAPSSMQDNTQTSSRLEYAHPDLPASLSVHSIPGRGRGIVAEQAFKPGSTLVSTDPLVSVLDNRNLSQRCSTCYRLAEDTLSQKPLQRCSLCHVVQYCSPSCQNQDWRLHKYECKAMKNMTSLAKQHGKSKGKNSYVPETPVRAIGRLLWRNELDGEPFSKQIEALESHREKLTTEEQEEFFHLSIAVSRYVGQPTVLKCCSTPATLIDLLSRFASNSFSLTSPTDLTNIGVSISPLTALFNHACRPNAVVVFPSFPSPSPSPSLSTAGSTRSLSGSMRVVAIQPIEPGEEVLTSYVDLALPQDLRRKDLQDRYKFECRCDECMRTDVDPRQAFECPQESCTGLLRIVEGGGESACSICRQVFEVPNIDEVLKAAKSAYAEADKTQYSDPAASKINLLNLVSSLSTTTPTTTKMTAPRLSQSCYPLFQSRSLLLTLQLHSHSFGDAAQTALSAWKGASSLYPYGHPVRSILSTTVAQLASVPPVNPSPEEDLRYWTHLKDRTNGLRMLVEALRECEIGFGKKDGGGQVGKKLRSLIRDQEEGIEMGRKVTRELR